jgi:hypothetical protein
LKLSFYWLFIRVLDLRIIVSCEQHLRFLPFLRLLYFLQMVIVELSLFCSFSLFLLQTCVWSNKMYFYLFRFCFDTRHIFILFYYLYILSLDYSFDIFFQSFNCWCSLLLFRWDICIRLCVCGWICSFALYEIHLRTISFFSKYVRNFTTLLSVLQ